MIRALSEKELPAAVALVWETFCTFEAPDYSDEGVRSFRAFLQQDQLALCLKQGKMAFYGAFEGEKLVGVAALRNQNHLCLLFVSRETMRQGFGTALMQRLQAEVSAQGFEALTVNSSPYAVPFYHQIGFVDLDGEQLQDGIRFTPMRWEWEVLSLRPHHGMCIQHFVGKGYSEAFTANMWRVIGQLQQTDPLIRLQSGEDVLCACCPHHQNGCVSGQKVRQMDAAVLSLTGQQAGHCVRWSAWERLVREQILNTEAFERVCSSCEWLATCQAVRQNGEKA